MFNVQCLMPHGNVQCSKLRLSERRAKLAWTLPSVSNLERSSIFNVQCSMEERVSLLDTVPVHASHVWTEVGENGCLTLAYNRFPKPWMAKVFARWYDPVIHVPLEHFGSEIWQLIDGKRSAEEVIRQVSLSHPEEENLPQRIALYLSKLHQDGFIILIQVSQVDEYTIE